MGEFKGLVSVRRGDSIRAAVGGEKLAAGALGMAVLWSLLFLGSWRSFFPWTELAFLAVLLYVAFKEPKFIPLASVLGLFCPMSLGVPRPFVLVLAVLCVAAVFRISWKNAYCNLRGPEFVAIGTFVGFCFLSIAGSPDLSNALRYSSLYFVSFVLIAFVMVTSHSLQVTVVMIQGLVVLAGSALAINTIHNLFRDEMASTNAFLRMAETVGRAGEIKYSVVSGAVVEAGRLIWAGLEPNYWAAQLLFPVLCGIGLTSGTRGGSRLFWILMSAAGVIGILGTYSRAGFLAVSLGVVAFLVMRGGRSWIPMMFLIGAGAVAIWNIPYLFNRLRSIESDIVERGAAGRFAYWERAFDRIVEAPVFGHGTGSFFSTEGFAVHNTYLQVAAENGLVGLLLYLTIIGLGLRAWWSAARRATRHGDAALAALALGGLCGTLSVCLAIGSISAQDARLVWLPVAIGALVNQLYRPSVLRVSQADVGAGRL